jgi:tetratricopeptide (TPR) repeat protein
MGVARMAQGRIDEALAHYAEAVQLDPRCLNAQNNLGSALLTQGKVAEAVRTYRAAILALPEAASLRHNLAAALRRLGHEDEAAAEEREARRLDRRRPHVESPPPRDLALRNTT